MSRVLLIGGSYSSLPLAQAILDEGHELIVAGNRSEEPAHQLASRSVLVDYSSISDFMQAITPLQVDFCVPSSNDRAYRAGTVLAREMALPGYDTPAIEEAISLKSNFRANCERLGLPSPKAHTLEAAMRLLEQNHKLIVKPVDSFSGIGMSLLEDPQQIESVVEYARVSSPTRSILIEDFLEGTLHSHSMFWRNGCLALDFFVDEFCTQRQFQVNSSNHPSRLGQPIKDEVRGLTTKLARDLKLADGLLHTQFIVSSRGVMLIESMRRCPGDLFQSLIERSSGFDYSRAYVGPFLGESHLPPMRAKEIFVARHTVNSPADSYSWSIEFDGETTGWAVVPLTTSGSYVKASPNSKSGIVFVSFASADALWQCTPRIVDRCNVLDRRTIRGGMQRQ